MKTTPAGAVTAPKHWMPDRDRGGCPGFSLGRPCGGAAAPHHSTEGTEAQRSDKFLDLMETHTASKEQSLGLNLVSTNSKSFFCTSLWQTAGCLPKPSSSSWTQH